jgi:BirA family transcriptional regulator, biotin operon repressor / biotin---[acetyl-CoA-carboxylase] ligase
MGKRYYSFFVPHNSNKQEMFSIVRLRTVGSTNKYAKDLVLTNSVSENHVILSHEQTSGKGQIGNSWESEAGKNLTFSIILFHDNLEAASQFCITQIVSLAVCDTLKPILSGHNVSIKWPNDIYVGLKKICGILIENHIMGAYISNSIIGIGLNINQKEFFSNAPNPVSIIQLTNFEYDIEIILQRFLEHFENRIKQHGQNPDSLNSDYLSTLLFCKEWRKYNANNELFEGFIQGVNEYGQLQVLKRNGKEMLYNFKEISFVME